MKINFDGIPSDAAGSNEIFQDFFFDSSKQSEPDYLASVTENTSVSLYDGNSDGLPDHFISSWFDNSVQVTESGTITYNAGGLLTISSTDGEGFVTTGRLAYDSAGEVVGLYFHKNGDGKITTDFGGADFGYSMVAQSDGKILVAGESDGDFALARYNSDGSLDATFSGDGKLTTDLGGSDGGYSMVMQSDGQILVAGYSYNGGKNDFALARYNPDGSLDPTFSGDGKVTTGFGSVYYGGYSNSVVIQSDKKILVAGIGPAVFALVRYNPDGTLDTTFSGDGKLTTDFGGIDYATSVVMKSDVRILVVGSTDNGISVDFALACYNLDGSLDTTFSGDGKLTTDFGGIDHASSVVMQSDGKILVAGDSDGDFALARYNSDGSFDTSFSGDGKLTTDFGENDYASSMVIPKDGKIILAGYTFNDTGSADFALVRYNADGSLDTTFSDNGKLTTTFDSVAGGFSVKVQTDGKIIVAGTTGNNSDFDFALARYNPDGSLDTTFSGYPDTVPPTVITFSPSDGATGMAVDRNIVVTFSEMVQKGAGTITIHSGSAIGTVVENYDVATSTTLVISGTALTINPTADLLSNTQYYVTFDAGAIKDMAGNPNAGTTVYDFTTGSKDGKIITDFGGDDFGFGMALQIDGKIIMTGTSNGDFALVRYNQNGSLDTTFDTDGKVTTDFGGSDWGVDVTVRSDGKLFVVGYNDTRVVLAGYNSNGSLDASFGTGGKVTTDFDSRSQSHASIALQSDGKILVAGWINGDFALARYNIDGTLDTTFNGNGEVTTDFGYDDQSGSVAVQSDGKILVAGLSGPDSYSDFALVRYNSNGTLDAGFGTGGKLTTDFDGTDDHGHGMAIQSDGKILVVGMAGGANDDGTAVARYNVNGTLDTTFSEDGKVTTDLGGGLGFGVTLQPDGKILVAGVANQDGPFAIGDNSDCDFGLVRYNTDGTLDNTFGAGGKIVTDFGGTEFATTVALQSDGKIVLSGYSNNGFALARYNTDGSLDASFDGVSDTYTHTGTSGNDSADLYTISGNTSLPENVTTYVFDGLGGTDTLTLSMDGAYPGCFLSTNFIIPVTPDASGQYVISGTIMSDIMVTLKLTSVELLVFADKIVSLAYPGSIDATPPTIVVFNPPGISPTSSSISVTFSEPIQKGTGYIYLRGDGGYRADYNVATSFNLTISGSTITISPTTVFAADREYSVTFAPGSIKDTAGNGCLDTTEYHFNTYSGSNTLPSSTPQIGFGKVATDFGGGYEFGTGITMQPDSKILVAGISINAGNMDVDLVRYNADGSLDTSFGGGQGKITTDFGYTDMGIWLSVLTDGKVLVGGQSVINWGSYGKSILARYNADGTLDTSFDGDGKVITTLESGLGLYTNSGIVQKDGKIVVAGSSSGMNSFTLLRYNSDGSLDTSFGTDGVVITTLHGLVKPQFEIQLSDSKLLVVGRSSNGVNNDIALARYNVDGSLDANFNGDGIVNTDLGGDDQGFGVAVQSGGKILVAGESNGNIALLRYNGDGSLDTSFAGNGKVIEDLGGSDGASGLVVLPDGKILVSGSSNTDVVLLRFNADGTLDSTFSGNGKVTANIGGDFWLNGSGISGATLQADGKILVSGQSNGDIGVVRFNADGTLDTTFGLSVNTAPAFSERRAGTITTDFGGEDTGRSVIVQPDGKIFVAGYSGVAINGVTSYNIALARYIADGTNAILDTSFGLGGKLTTDLGGNDYGRSVAVLSDGKILLAGSSTVAGGTADFILARYNADGTLDSTFATNGKVITDFSNTNDTGNSIKVLSDGKIIVAGTSGNDFALARYNSNGALDTTFHGGGKFTTDFGGTESGMSVTVQSNGKILLAGTSTLPGGNADFALARYNADGSLDTTFHGDGKLTTDFGGTDTAQSVVVQSDGKIIVAGSSIAIMDGVAMFNSNFALARYNTDGSLDTTFHGDGRLTTDFGATAASGCSVILQSDGKILVAGSSTKPGGKSDFALARYNTDGSLDASFSGDGRFTMDFGGSSDTCYSISIDGNGKILVGGTSNIDGNGDFALARLNSDGTIDITFGGLKTTPIYTETPVVLDSFIQINDTELAIIGNFAGATLMLIRHDGAVAEDLFSNTGTLGALIEGSSLVVGSTTIGTVNSNSLGSLELGFNANATQNLVNSVLQQIAYSNTSHAPAASVQIDWIFSDGNTGSQGSGGVMTAISHTTVQFSTDTMPPAVTSFSPVDGVLGVTVECDIVLTFSEAIHRGSGAIEIHSGSANGTVVQSYDVATSSNLTIAGNTLILNPTAALAYGTHYFVTFGDGNVKDLAGNNFSGTSTYDFTTQDSHTLRGGVTFWKTGAPIADVSSTLTSITAAIGTQPVEFRNIQVAADGSRTIEIWETSPKSDIGSVDLEFSLSAGSVATWQSSASLPGGWTILGNTDKPGHFILGGYGATALSVGPVKLGSLSLTAPTNVQHFDLSLSAGQLGNDIVPTFGITSDSMTTGTDGLYQHLDTPDGTYALTSAKVSGTSEGNAVKANDALAALKMAVGINPNGDGSPVSPYQYLAADVNHDGQVKAADALNILKMAVKLDTAPAKEWLFVPESVGSEAMSRTHVVWPDNPTPVTLDTDLDLHLIGIVKGDVDGSWVA